MHQEDDTLAYRIIGSGGIIQPVLGSAGILDRLRDALGSRLLQAGSRQAASYIPPVPVRPVQPGSNFAVGFQKGFQQSARVVKHPAIPARKGITVRPGPGPQMQQVTHRMVPTVDGRLQPSGVVTPAPAETVSLGVPGRGHLGKQQADSSPGFLDGRRGMEHLLAKQYVMPQENERFAVRVQ